MPAPPPAPEHPSENTPGVERIARYTDYNAAGQVTEQENAYGQSFFFDYDTQGRLEQALTYRNGEKLSVTYIYNNRGRLAQITDENDAVRQFVYDGLGRLSDVFNDAGAPVAEHAYHLTGPGGDVGSDPSYVRTTAPGGNAGHGDGTTTPGQVTTNYVDGLGRAVQTHQHVGPSGALGSERIVAATAYDALGREHKQYRPYRQSSSAFDAGGPTGRPATETRYFADPLGRPNEIDPPGAGVQERTYGVASTDLPGTLGAYRTQDAIDEEGNRTRTYTDGFGETVATVGDPLGIAATTRFTYNAAGDLTSVQKPEGDEVIYYYDARGNLIYQHDPDRGTTQMRYDAAGTLRFSQNAAQHAEGTLQYRCVDDLGRPTRQGVAPVDHFGTETVQDFQSLPPEASCTETSDATVRTAWRYGEELSGNENNIFPWSRAEGFGVTNMPTANSLGRVVMTARRTGPIRAEDGTLTDGTSAEAKWRVTTHSYDAEGRLAEKNIGAPGFGRTRIRYTYDRQGHLTKRRVAAFPAASTLTQWYTYTPRGQTEAVYAAPGTPGAPPSKPSVPEVSYTYTADGQVEHTTYRNGLDEARTYDIRGRLAEIGDQQVQGETLYQQYDYRLNSQIDRVETYGDVTAAGATSRFHYDYTYDALGRLTGADYFEGGFANATSSAAYDLSGVSYDQNGNLTALQRRDDSGTPVDALAYDYAHGTNRLTGVTDAEGPLHDWDAGSGSFRYDNRGRLTHSTAAPYVADTLIYNDQDLPVRIEGLSGGTEVTYRYSAGGQRTYTRIGTQAPSFTLRDGAARLGTAIASDSGTGSNATLTHWNILTPSGTPVGRFVDGSSSERRYYHTGHLGSIRAVTDEGGQVVERKDYYPFGLQMPGRTLTQGPPADEDFTGHELDDETGLHYAGARYYMSALGRWGTPDPLADDFPAWSPYNYVQNNPISLLDPDGQAPMDWYRDDDDSIRFDSEVQSQDDLDEGQEYLGERVLARTEGGGAYRLEDDGSVSTVFEGEGDRTALEEGALAGSGFSTVVSRAGDTFSMADDPLADKLAKGAKRTGLLGTVASTTTSMVSAGRGNSSWTHVGINAVADLGLTGLSLAGGLPGGVAAVVIDGSGLKGAAVDWGTVQIESLRVDEVINEVNINNIAPR